MGNGEGTGLSHRGLNLSNNMRIAQISDTHILARASDHSEVDRRADWLRRCIADINQQQADAVVFTGDTVHLGQDEEYAYLRELLAPLIPPLYLVPGNRDNNQALSSAFRDFAYLPEGDEHLHYEIDDHWLRFVAIDSTAKGERKGIFCEARQQRLESVLSEQPDKPTVLFIHHPPFDVDDHYVGGYRKANEAAALAKIISEHKQVLALLCGHVHCAVDYNWAGTRALAMPSIAVDLRKEVDESEALERPIYLLHEFTDNVRFNSQARMVSN